MDRHHNACVARALLPAKPTAGNKLVSNCEGVGQNDVLAALQPGMAFIPETNFLFLQIQFLTLHFFYRVYNRP
jgi:hypothetical protein